MSAVGSKLTMLYTISYHTNLEYNREKLLIERFLWLKIVHHCSLMVWWDLHAPATPHLHK